MASSGSARCPMMDRTLEATMLRNLRIAIAMLTAVLFVALGMFASAQTAGPPNGGGQGAAVPDFSGMWVHRYFPRDGNVLERGGSREGWRDPRPERRAAVGDLESSDAQAQGLGFHACIELRVDRIEDRGLERGADDGVAMPAHEHGR